MERRINLTDIEAVKAFMKACEESKGKIMVTKEGYRYLVDGESLLGMMSMMGKNILVDFGEDESGFADIINEYEVR